MFRRAVVAALFLSLPAPLNAQPTAESYPLDLATALRLADANNPTVGVARARSREAAAQLARSRVLWVPTLSFGPTFFYHGGIDQNRRGDIFTVSRGYYTLGAGPTLRVDLADALYLPLVARQNARAASEQIRTTTNNIQLEVALAYLDLLEAHARIVINADILNRAERILKSAEAGAKSGISKTAADVNRAATEVNLRREEAMALRGSVAAASAKLSRLLLLDPTVELTPYEPAVVPLVLIPGETTLRQLVDISLRTRPEMATARALVGAANAAVRQAKAAPLLPRVQADFIGGGLSGGLGNNFSPLQSQYNAGVAAVWNLDALGLGNIYAIRGRQAASDAARMHLREIESLVASQVAEAARVSAARYAALGPAQESVRQALEMYRKFREASFALMGAKGQLQFDALEVLTALNALNQARVQYLQQVVEFNRSQFRLYTAIGQPATCGADAATPQPLTVPVVPGGPATPATLPVPRPAPVPAAAS